MARIRSIKPEFPQSETIGKLSRDARLLFIQIWTIVDDDGRTRAPSRMLASLLYPYDDDAAALIEGWLSELEQQGCVRRYDVEGSRFLDLPNWLKHQKIDHKSVSKLPAYEDGIPVFREASRSLSPDLGPRILDLGEEDSSLRSLSCEREASRNPSAKFIDGQIQHQSEVKEKNPVVNLIHTRKLAIAESHPEFAEFWAVYPNHVGRKLAEKSFAKAVSDGTMPATILDGAKRYAILKSGTDPKFIAHASTWINQERWTDEHPVSGSQHNGRSASTSENAAYPDLGIQNPLAAAVMRHRAQREARERDAHSAASDFFRDDGADRNSDRLPSVRVVAGSDFVGSGAGPIFDATPSQRKAIGP